MKRVNRRKYSIAATLVMVIAAALVLLPLIWVFFTSVKSLDEFYMNIWGLPKQWRWENYTYAWEHADFAKGLMNSLIVTLGALAVNLTCSTTTAYALARYRFRFRTALRQLYIMAIMVPSLICLIPQYFLLSNLHLLDSRLGMILVYGLSSVPFATFVLYGFFQTLPHELEEAALIDGASHVKTFARVMLPLAQPGVVTVAVVSFIDYWNEYYKAMTYLSSPEKMTIPVGLVNFSTQCQYRISYGPLMASCIIMIVPTMAVYCMFRKSIQKGLTAGAVKG